VPDPTSSFLVSKALQGLARLNKTIDTRYPITISILEKLLAALLSVCSSPYEGKLFASAFVLAYYGLLRVGEFTIDTTTRLRNSHCITFQNLTLDRQASKITLTIPHSKTDQTGQTTSLIIRRQPHTPACPIQNIQSFFEIRPCTPNHHCFFIHHNYSPLTRSQFQAVLQKCISFCGIPGHFATHSFRIGRATDLALQGFPNHKIQTLGRWKSMAFQKYIRTESF
jgi:hypothetical protein